MREQIPISPKVPRSVADLDSQMDLNKGLRDYYFFGYFFLIGTFVCVLAALFVPSVSWSFKMAKVVIILLFFGTLAILSLGVAYKRHNKRLQAVKTGEVINAKVVEHGRQFSPFKSTQDYTVTVEYNDGEGHTKREKLVSPRGSLQRAAPMNSMIVGLVDVAHDVAFFPVEIGEDIRGKLRAD